VKANLGKEKRGRLTGAAAGGLLFTIASIVPRSGSCAPIPPQFPLWIAGNELAADARAADQTAASVAETPKAPLPPVWSGHVSEPLALLRDSVSNLYLDSSNQAIAGATLGTAALLANTSLDEEIRNLYQRNVRNDTLDSFSSIINTAGQTKAVLSSFVVAYGIGQTFQDLRVLKEWSQRAAIAALIAEPALLACQYGLRGTRPENGKGSRWLVSADYNAASGHVYLLAIPFLTASDMTENKYAKIALIAASTFGVLARINSDAHYSSQVLLGYTWAFLSVKAVSGKIPQPGGFQIAPLADRGAIGFRVTKRY